MRSTRRKRNNRNTAKWHSTFQMRLWTDVLSDNKYSRYLRTIPSTCSHQTSLKKILVAAFYVRMESSPNYNTLIVKVWRSRLVRTERSERVKRTVLTIIIIFHFIGRENVSMFFSFYEMSGGYDQCDPSHPRFGTHRRRNLWKDSGF